MRRSHLRRRFRPRKTGHFRSCITRSRLEQRTKIGSCAFPGQQQRRSRRDLCNAQFVTRNRRNSSVPDLKVPVGRRLGCSCLTVVLMRFCPSRHGRENQHGYEFLIFALPRRHPDQVVVSLGQHHRGCLRNACLRDRRANPLHWRLIGRRPFAEAPALANYLDSFSRRRARRTVLPRLRH